MYTAIPHYTKSFQCLAGDCPLTCCRGWEVVVDEGFLSALSEAPSHLQSIFRTGLHCDPQGESSFRAGPDGACPLLLPDGLCAIQRDWGADRLPVHCAQHPRFWEEYGCRRELSLAVSCPEAARLLLEQRGFAVDEADDGGNDLPFDGVDPILLAGLIRTRDMALDLLRQEGSPLPIRLRQVYGLAAAAQRLLDAEDWAGLSTLSCPPAPAAAGLSRRRELSVSLLRLLAHFEPLDPQWPALLLQRADELEALSDAAYRRLCRNYEWACSQWEGRLSQLACYLIFRHWPKALNDDRLLGRAAMAVTACLTLYHLSALSFSEQGPLSVQQEALQWAAFSREVEHLDDTFDRLVDLLSLPDQWPLSSALCPTETEAGAASPFR